MRVSRRFVLGALLLAAPGVCSGQAPPAAPDGPVVDSPASGPLPLPPPPPAGGRDFPPCPVPTMSLSPGGNRLPPEKPAQGDLPLPINLATALRLADARPIVIAAAAAGVQQAA